MNHTSVPSPLGRLDHPDRANRPRRTHHRNRTDRPGPDRATPHTAEPILVKLAKRGNSNAIASLIRQALPHLTHVTVSQRRDHLHIHLEGIHLPDRDRVIPVIQHGLSQLRLTAIRRLTIQAQQSLNTAAAWEESVPLRPDHTGLGPSNFGAFSAPSPPAAVSSPFRLPELPLGPTAQTPPDRPGTHAPRQDFRPFPKPEDFNLEAVLDWADLDATAPSDFDLSDLTLPLPDQPAPQPQAPPPSSFDPAAIDPLPPDLPPPERLTHPVPPDPQSPARSGSPHPAPLDPPPPGPQPKDLPEEPPEDPWETDRISPEPPPLSAEYLLDRNPHGHVQMAPNASTSQQSRRFSQSSGSDRSSARPTVATMVEEGVDVDEFVRNLFSYYGKEIFVIFCLLFIPFLGILLMWSMTDWPKPVKWWITGIRGVIWLGS
ncbi:MAG: hypothetical protein VKJ85_03090 [Prochlorothrix sp.]|nr:hypothetical protein [Prochlorothrix sp.]